MRREVLERRLLDFVKRTLLRSDPTLPVSEDTALFEEGIVDSLRILDLIAFVENETRAKVPDEAVRLANFRSVRAIAAAFGGNGLRTQDATGDEVSVLRIFERASRPGFARPFDALRARGELVLVQPGRIVFRGPPLRLLRYFDTAVRSWAAELGAEELRFSATVPAPAVCTGVYPAWEGRRLGVRPVLLTARGRCFRDENLDPARGRLREFEMREIVALGSREEVERFRQDLITRVSALVTLLDLQGRIETASDPFFLQAPADLAGDPRDRGRELRGRRLVQQVLPLKYELRLALDESGEGCAVASFNHHLDHFGRRFGIRLESGATAHTGCVALGLERWVLAFLSQHGTDERQWPEPVRDFYARKEARERLA